MKKRRIGIIRTGEKPPESNSDSLLLSGGSFFGVLIR